jgi:hypothetical protein
MRIAAKTLLLLATAIVAVSALRDATAAPADATGAPVPGPQYAGDGQLKFPAHYREWTYLTSGFDMSYSAGMQMGGHHMFDNVFVDPAAYAAFQRTGTWPDKTVLVLEHRAAQSKGSINQQGNFQTGVMDVEVHVKDERRFSGKWAFFAFGGDDKTSAMIPAAASCYSCHSAHGAVNTTFVQFYPTLLPIAEAKGTFGVSGRSATLTLPDR